MAPEHFKQVYTIKQIQTLLNLTEISVVASNSSSTH